MFKREFIFRGLSPLGCLLTFSLCSLNWSPWNIKAIPILFSFFSLVLDFRKKFLRKIYFVRGLYAKVEYKNLLFPPVLFIQITKVWKNSNKFQYLTFWKPIIIFIISSHFNTSLEVFLKIRIIWKLVCRR